MRQILDLKKRIGVIFMQQAAPENITFVIAFFSGIAYFLSPCVLPLVPSYLSYITGMSFDKLTQDSAEQAGSVRKKAFFHALFFVLGFSCVFVLLGLSASIIGQVLTKYLWLIKKIGGALIVFFGLFIMGILKIPFLMQNRTWAPQNKPLGYAGSFFVGIAFSAGWTACSTPILSAILVYTSTGKTIFTGAMLLAVFSLGLGVPFIISAVAINSFLSFFNTIKKYLRVIEIISGIILIVFGVLIFTDSLGLLTGLIYKIIKPY